MMSIGEFAGMTGLSVKALRHYDERGVLVPGEVDERTGYRWYGEDQVRAGVVVRALRDAGVPLPEVADAVAGGDPRGALDAHRERALAERAREDLAVEAAERGLSALSAPVEVVERRAAAQPWVGRLLAVPPDEAEGIGDEVANELLLGLHRALVDAGHAPTGPFWTTLRGGERAIEIVFCWPTDAAPEPGWGGAGTVAGVLPERTELVATWRTGSDADEPPETMTHPAIVALFDAIADRDLDLRATEIRQTVLGADEHDRAVEIALTLPDR